MIYVLAIRETGHSIDVAHKEVQNHLEHVKRNPDRDYRCQIEDNVGIHRDFEIMLLPDVLRQSARRTSGIHCFFGPQTTIIVDNETNLRSLPKENYFEIDKQ